MGEKLQIRLEYNPGEDRLLLCISERESRGSCIQYRVWLTRRFVKVILKTIDTLITKELTADMQITPEALAMMKKFQREAALAKADFSTSYDTNAGNCSKFGKNPLLVTTLKMKKRSRGKYVLSLLDNKNIGIHLTANMDLIYSLQKMLLDSGTKAAWNQPLFLAVDGEVETRESPRYII